MGDEAVGFETTVDFTRNDLTLSLYLDIIRVRVGRAVIGFKFCNFDERIPNGPAIVQAVVARVTEAEASA